MGTNYGRPPVVHRQWVQEAISNGKGQRESCWTESIAVGNIGFVEETKAKLGIRGKGRTIEENEAGGYVLKEDFEPYSVVINTENEYLSPENSHSLDVLCVKLAG